uniref:Uncharacterized protein n=1 Tax=Oryza brachyantha TaxID=4533 RepID=J3KX44_ORYBR
MVESVVGPCLFLRQYLFLPLCRTYPDCCAKCQPHCKTVPPTCMQIDYFKKAGQWGRTQCQMLLRGGEASNLRWLAHHPWC